MKQQVRQLLLDAAGNAYDRSSPLGVGSPTNLLVIRPDHMGDLLLSVPALRWLRRRLPMTTISLMVGPWNREIAEHIPFVDNVLTYPFPWFDRKPKRAPWKPYLQIRDAAQTLRPHHFDMAITLRHDFWWGAWMTAAADIPQRAGYQLPETAPFLNQPIAFDSYKHEVEQTLTLVQAALPSTNPVLASVDESMEFAVTDDERAFADAWLEEHEAADRPLIAIHPGAGAPVKQWRPERFGELAQHLSQSMGARIVLTGDTGEASLVQQVVDSSGDARPVPLIGARLGQVAAVLQRCQLAVGGDAGIMHLAAAVGTPTVRLYGPVDPKRFGPWGKPGEQRVVQSELPCVPCNRLDYSPSELVFHPCVRSITLHAVLSAIKPLLAPMAVTP